MLKELLTYFLETPALKEARKFGHLKESISLISREARCKTAWLPHRTQCKNFILESLNKAQNYDSLLILGSGPLHEIPIKELALKFKKIVCVDIVHLGQTKKSVAQYKNIEFVEHDISETEKKLSHGSLETLMPERFLGEKWGLVLSVNIMSQLPLHLEKFISHHFKGQFDELQVKNYLKKITENHLAYLRAFKSPAILITDVEVHYLDCQEKLIENNSHLGHLNLPAPDAQWFWNLAPIPEYDKDVAIKMKVQAYLLNNH